MDAAGVALLREVLSSTTWVDRTRAFARSLRSSTRTAGGLLLVGTPEEEPWHLAAHLDDESRYAGVPELSPTLVRWRPPKDAPAHLAVGLDRLEGARRGETVFVVAPDVSPSSLLERVSDARRVGATVFAIDGGDPELEDLAHDAITVPSAGLTIPPETAKRLWVPENSSTSASSASDIAAPAMSFEIVQHLVSAAAGEETSVDPRTRRGLRDRLARLLDVVSGPPPQ